MMGVQNLREALDEVGEVTPVALGNRLLRDVDDAV
jgi:hypothetical protein